MKILTENENSFEILKAELESGYPIIVPTDTNYNLCCLPDNYEAIDRVFEFKIRPKNKPLSIFFDKPLDWRKYGKTPHTNLMNLLTLKFWPGALNIIVDNNSEFNYAINDSDTIALGCVSNPTFRNFVNYLGRPVAITSANISGTADDLLITEEVALEHMGGKVNYLLKSSKKGESSKSSTIIKVNADGTVSLIREGDLPFVQIQSAIQEEGLLVEN